MAYQPIALKSNTPDEIVSFVRNTIDKCLSEFRFLLTVQMPDQGSKGSLQIPMLTLLLAATDGAAQFLVPTKMAQGIKFQRFLTDNFPWELDPPEGLTIDEVCDFLWNEVRCPLFHRYSLQSSLKQSSSSLTIKYGRIFTIDDEKLTQFELSKERPYTEPTIKRNHNKTIVWIESFYWALRLAISRSLDSDKKIQAVMEWIKSGQWDPK